MNVKNKAKRFAVKAHINQVRKSEPEKPMIVHPINSGNILEEYGFDENVIAASYLHDVVEDTNYTILDITDKFGDDIASLVSGATEPDKSLSWEERKKHTIKTIKTLDLRHKAVVCADKISNLEDMMIMFEKNSNYDFSKFKRGFDSQKWYYEKIYESLIYNEDKNHPMFIRLKNLIDQVFNKQEDNYLKNVIFKNRDDEYKELKILNYKQKEIKKLNSVLKTKKPYVIEFTGTPRTGKTTLINNLYDLFKKGGLKVSILEEFTTSKKYKKEVYPLLKNEYKKVVNFEIPKYVKQQLIEEIKKDLDIIIIDRSLFDRTIWIDRLYLKNGLNNEEYNGYFNEYIPLIKDNINIVIATYTDSLTALKRDYSAYLSLEKRNFLNEDNVNEYNKSLLNMQELAKKYNIKFNLFDTTNKTQRDVSIDIANIILNDIRSTYIKNLNKDYR